MDSIVRIAKSKATPYVMLDKQLTENRELSFGARGMMAYLLSKPNDWHVRMADLENGPDGRARVRSLFKELEEAGYVKRTRKRLTDGTWQWTTTVYESPVATDHRRESTDGETDDLLSTQSPNTHNVSDSNESDTDAPKRAPRRSQSPDQRQHNAARSAVRAYFEHATGLKCPPQKKGRSRKGVASQWWNPIREICELAEWDVPRAQRLVDDAVKRLRGNGLTVSDPNSILKTARALAAENQSRMPAPQTKDGVYILPSSSRR